MLEREAESHGRLWRAWLHLKALGPGLITGAADDDPSGIGTCAQTGAMFGYAQLWVCLLCLPLMVAVQETCARVALQTGLGLADNIRRHYPRYLLYPSVALLCLANTVNIGADLGAMAASAHMLLPVSYWAWLALMAVLIVALMVLLKYRIYVNLLRLSTLALLAYVLMLFLVKEDWPAALRGTLIPLLSLRQEYLMNVVALLGTTISPYLFFWQSNQEVEEALEAGNEQESDRAGASAADMKWMRTDIAAGMVLSQFVAWAVIATTAFTLHSHGIRDIQSAPQAAEALRPLAGDYAYALFAAGIIGTGMLAIPVLAGSAAYAVSDTFRLPSGLNHPWREARGFYGVIAAAMAVGVLFDLAGINPIKALYYAAVVNGLAAPILMVLIMLISGNSAIMGRSVSGRWSRGVGWTATGLMAFAAAAMAVQMLSGKAG